MSPADRRALKKLDPKTCPVCGRGSRAKEFFVGTMTLLTFGIPAVIVVALVVRLVRWIVGA